MINIAVVDTETTGTGNSDSVVEVAMVGVPTKEQIEFCSLVRPTCPISIESMAAHHITEEEVADAPPLDDVYQHMPLMGVEYIVAHNMEFDRRFLPMLADRKWICTWKCAMHIWPDAPSYSNQVLRYWLKVQPPEHIRKIYHPHRAIFDTWITALIFEKMLESRTAECLFLLSTQPVVLKKVRFGKHNGQLWADVPRDYLVWVLKQKDMDADVLHTARFWMGQKR